MLKRNATLKGEYIRFSLNKSIENLSISLLIYKTEVGLKTFTAHLIS